MRERLVPQDFKVPQRFEMVNYYCVPISTKNAEEDLQVLLSNADMIVQLRGGGSRTEWPFVCTLEENYQDLAWLEICARYGQLFSYLIRGRDDNRYAGCVYIYPIELFYPDLAEKYDVDFSFWITKIEYDKGAYPGLFGDLLTWLTQDWPFSRSRIYLRNKEIPQNLKSF